MYFSEDQIRDLLELKEKISEQIEQHRKDIELLEKNLAILNSILKQTSFAKASSIKSQDDSQNKKLGIPIKKGDGATIANVFVTPDKVSIILEDDVNLNSDIPPFKTFFINRIIGQMKEKDDRDAQIGKIERDSIINCIINKNGNAIREIIVKNYRQQERVNEIINTATWSLSRMIENLKK